MIVKGWPAQDDVSLEISKKVESRPHTVYSITGMQYTMKSITGMQYTIYSITGIQYTVS